MKLKNFNNLHVKTKILYLILFLTTIILYGCHFVGYPEIQDTISIYGTAAGTGFTSFNLEVGEYKGREDVATFTSNGITLRFGGTQPITDDLLATWDTTFAKDGNYVVRLKTVTNSGTSYKDLQYFKVNNVEFSVNYLGDTINVSGRIPNNVQRFTIEHSLANVREFSAEGVTLAENIHSGGNFVVLGSIDKAALKYNGRHLVRLTVYGNNNIVSEEEEEIIIDDPNLISLLPSEIKNDERNNVVGYIQLKLQKVENGNWIDKQILIDDIATNRPRTLLSKGGKIDISKLFDQQIPYITTEPGKYRVYGKFVDRQNVIISIGESRLEHFSEFEVLNKERPINQLEACQDQTPRFKCSAEKPKFCTFNLDLVDNCNSCGCTSGQVCQNNVCVAGEQPRISCTETDNGADYSQKGIVTTTYNGFSSDTSDYCNNDNTLTEFFCYSPNDFAKFSRHICENVCRDGACVAESAPSSFCNIITAAGASTSLPTGIRFELDGRDIYCSAAGTLEAQKGPGESCRKNYECKEGSCDNGKCISVKSEISFLKNLVARIWCTLINPIDTEERVSCINNIIAPVGVG